MRPYAFTVSNVPQDTTTPAAAAELSGKRRRRTPSQTEQARREAWGRKWGQVGHEYAVRRRQREGR